MTGRKEEESHRYDIDQMKDRTEKYSDERRVQRFDEETTNELVQVGAAKRKKSDY